MGERVYAKTSDSSWCSNSRTAVTKAVVCSTLVLSRSSCLAQAPRCDPNLVRFKAQLSMRQENTDSPLVIRSSWAWNCVHHQSFGETQGCLVFPDVYAQAEQHCPVTLRVRERKISYVMVSGTLEKGDDAHHVSVCDLSPACWTLTGLTRISGDSSLVRVCGCAAPHVGNDDPYL